MVELHALGPLELHDERGPFTSVLTQPKRAALLAYLALARPRGFQRRDGLLALFWPELDAAHARNALSQALTFLRRELPDGVLVTRGSEEVGVDPTRVVCDVVAFEDAVDGDRWDQALMLYRGELLAGLHVSDAPGFERWLDAERDRLREAASGAAWSLAEAHLEAGEPVEAERAAQRALLLSPTDESPVRRFIEALARAGDRAAALAFYEKFRMLLAKELEVEPAPETAAVEEAVRNGEVVAEVPALGGAAGTSAERRGAGEGRDDTPPSGAVVSARPHASAARGRRFRERWLTGRRLGAALAGLVALVVVGDVLATAWLESRWVSGAGTLIGEGLAAPYDRVVVADLAASFDPGLGKVAAEWLRTELDQSDIIRPVSPTEIGAALQRMKRDPSLPLDGETAREIGVRDGYPLVVVGEMEDVGETFLVTARLESAEGEVLARFRAAAVAGPELVTALDRLGGEIRERIGESRRSIRRSPPLDRVTTSSLDALRLYTDATRLMSWQGRTLDAIPLLERVLEIDSTFAAAYFQLSRAAQDVPDWGRADALRRKAYEQREHLTGYERLMVEQERFSVEARSDPTWAPDECEFYLPRLGVFETYVRQHPDDVRPLNTYGFYLERAGRSDEAMVVYGRAIELGQATAGVLNNQIANLARRRRFEEAEALLELWRERFGESHRLSLAEMVVVGRKADYEAADSLYASYQHRYGPEPDIHLAQGRIDALRGRMAEAQRHYEAAIDDLERRGLPLGLAEPLTSRGFIRLVLFGDTVGALEPVVAWLGRLPADTTLRGEWVDVGVLRAMAGDAAGARVALDTLVATRCGNWSVVRGPLRASIALAEGRPADALDALAESEIPCTFNYTQFRTDPRLRHILAGRAREALGQPADAIAEYRAYLDEPLWSYPIGLDAIFLFDTLERLAALHEDLGHDDVAAGYYARAADLWADADPELQPRVRALRERAAALVGEGAGGDP